MKQVFILTTLAFLSFLISCGDIVNSDKNIEKTQITYKNVLSDQENGVIMTLKVGNKWIYQVTEIDTFFTIQKLYYDSIVVLDKEYINSELWFRVNFPMLSNQPILMTNTDVGLVYKYDKSEDGNSLLAKYPISTKEYSAHSEKVIYGDSTTQGRVDEKEIIADMLTGIQENESLKFGNKSYNSIVYFRTLRSKDYPNYYGKYSDDYYFVPNLGLFHVDNFRNYSKFRLIAEKSYELVYYSGLNGGALMQNLFTFDFGRIKLGESKTLDIDRIIQNNMDESVQINKISIFTDDSFSIINDLVNTVIEPGNTISVKINCSPKALGHFESILRIETSKGTFDFILKYDSYN